MKIGQALGSAFSSWGSKGDSDARGFYLADSTEGGSAHEVITDLIKPVSASRQFLVRRSKDMNEWILMNRDSSSFVMRAVVFYEDCGRFIRNFDSREISAANKPGRIRVAIYLSPEPFNGEPTQQPAVVMMSTRDRKIWQAFEVCCDACIYKKH